ncbi:MAG TPA: response regulator transcription factor [Planctomycetaceae bacterium]|jgi:two-component system copper resistance phosphate regulon response regulator CusR|nr:response regulator transcription factor [Planctomycetaceae bacterium]
MDAKILLVEDDAEIADFVVRGLREEGFSINRAADGDEGWQQLSNSEWDVVLLDWWLPGTDGLTLLRRFRKRNQTTPVLFLTAREAVSDRVTGLDSGADDYLCKPFAFAELLARVRVMTRRQVRPKTSFSWGDVKVDLATRHVERAGHRLNLTFREELLLVFMIRYPGEVLTRDRLYEEVWDDRYDAFSNTLEVHVMELRKKLEAYGPRLIHTVRNRGYYFGEEIG